MQIVPQNGHGFASTESQDLRAGLANPATFCNPLVLLAKAGPWQLEGPSADGIYEIPSPAIASTRLKILILLSNLGNGVTVAQQTLTLFV